jgi:hypothetical protein
MASKDDAALIVQILQWGSQMGVEAALGAIFSDNFNAETVTAADPDVRKVLYFGEAIGTLVKQGLLDRDLVLDMFAMEYSWNLVGPAALRLRERIGEPRMYENYEALARQSTGVGAAG